MNNQGSLLCARKDDFYIIDLTSQRLKACCKSPFPLRHQSLRDDLAEILQDREDLRQGVISKSCQTCWTLEAQGNSSFRSSVRYGPSPAQAKDHQPFILEFIVGNTCNLKCIYCGPDSSSQWLRQTDGMAARKQEPRLTDDILQLIEEWWDGIGIFNFIGGEPFLLPVVLKLIEQLKLIAQSRESRIQKKIRILTNLSVPEAQLNKFLSIADESGSFFKFLIGVSAESVGKRFEYIRDGAVFSNYEKNLEALLARPQIDPYFTSTFNFLALPYYDEFLNYTISKLKQFKRPIEFHYNEVVFPGQLSPHLLPGPLNRQRHDCQRLLKDLVGYNRTPLLEEKLKLFEEKLMSLFDSLHVKREMPTTTFEFLDRLDQKHMNRLQWKDIFPELIDLGGGE
jgi:hypothetical protein